MATQRPKNKYKCTQAELYAICSIGWQSYAENQAEFEAFSTLYTTAFGTDAMAEVEAAKNLPDQQARNQQTETAYILMVKAADSCLAKWRALRSYIRASFPEDLYKPNVEAAGQEHYTKALNHNWAETELLLTSALSFMAGHTAELTSGGMPATFEADFQVARNEFIEQYNTFTDSGQDEHEGTDQKVLANNKIYEKLLRMFEDAQVIYEKDPAKRERFYFARIKALISTPPSAGSGSENAVTLEGAVSDNQTLLPIANAFVQAQSPSFPEPITTQTGADGVYKLKIEGLAEGTTVNISLEVSAPNYQMAATPLDITAGQQYVQDFQLMPEPIP